VLPRTTRSSTYHPELDVEALLARTQRILRLPPAYLRELLIEITVSTNPEEEPVQAAFPLKSLVLELIVPL